MWMLVWLGKPLLYVMAFAVGARVFARWGPHYAWPAWLLVVLAALGRLAVGVPGGLLAVAADSDSHAASSAILLVLGFALWLFAARVVFRKAPVSRLLLFACAAEAASGALDLLALAEVRTIVLLLSHATAIRRATGWASCIARIGRQVVPASGGARNVAGFAEQKGSSPRAARVQAGDRASRRGRADAAPTPQIGCAPCRLDPGRVSTLPTTNAPAGRAERLLLTSAGVMTTFRNDQIPTSAARGGPRPGGGREAR